VKIPFNKTQAVPPSPCPELFANFKHSIGETIYIHSGFFAVTANKLTEENCRKLASAFFDIDYKEIVAVTPSLLERAQTRVASLPEELRSAIKNPAEFYVQSLLSEDETIAEVRPVVERAVELLQPFVGRPTKIVFSGNGAHLHYWLADDEGWSEDARAEVSALSNTARFNYLQYKAAIPLIAAAVNEQAGLPLFDMTVAKSIGARKCRDVGSLNLKSKENVKQTREVFADLCAPQNRLWLEQIVLPAAAASATASAKLGTSITEAVHEARASKLPATDIAGDYEVLVQVGDSAQVLTAHELFCKMTDEGISKIRVRMLKDVPRSNPDAQLSAGDCNGFAQMVVINNKPALKFYTSVAASKSYTKNGLWVLNPQAVGEAHTSWMYYGVPLALQRDPKGKPICNFLNFNAILEGDGRFKGMFRLNTRKRQVVVHRSLVSALFPFKRLSPNEWVAYTDPILNALLHDIMQRYMPTANPAITEFDRAIHTVAQQHEFDPVADFVSSLVWDGVDRLGDEGGQSWLNSVLHLEQGAQNYELYTQYGKVIALSTVHNIFSLYESGGGQHTALFAGPQGCGKSSLVPIFGLVEHLTPGHINKDYCKLDGISMSAKDVKDSAITLEGVFIAECPEAISTSNNTTMKEVKAFITTDSFNIRRPYERQPSRVWKNCFIFTNSNDEKFLTDNTGNRRFLVIDCFNDLHFSVGGVPALDLAWLRQNIEQIYAQAYQRVVQGNAPAHADRVWFNGVQVENWNLPRAWMAAQALHNEQFMAETNLHLATQRAVETLLLQGQDKIELKTILAVVRTYAPDIKEAQLRNHISESLKRLGWENRRFNYGNRWVRVRGAEEESSAPAPEAEATFEFDRPVRGSSLL
jgi:energy-coupling factor transporter ATP-binding protein EcfA2